MSGSFFSISTTSWTQERSEKNLKRKSPICWSHYSFTRYLPFEIFKHCHVVVRHLSIMNKPTRGENSGVWMACYFDWLRQQMDWVRKILRTKSVHDAHLPYTLNWHEMCHDTCFLPIVWLLDCFRGGELAWSNAIFGNECFHSTKKLKVLRVADPSKKVMIITKIILQPINQKEGQVFEISMSTSSIRLNLTSNWVCLFETSIDGDLLLNN